MEAIVDVKPSNAQPVDRILALALAIHTNKGAYAVLLGSGVSVASGIPTGGAIVEDLIRKLAAMEGVEPAPSPREWFTARFGQPPGYAELLRQLGNHPAERSGLLRDYLNQRAEATGPSKAHLAIASLAAQGCIRVILTTNFDDLMEEALKGSGVSHHVISTAEQANSAFPRLSHGGVCVVKLHGDFRELETRNTPDELAEYDPRMVRVLERVLTEYGLVICGWSGEWDTALRDMLTSRANHYFSTYWATHSEPGPFADSVIRSRKADVISIEDADSFFCDLEQKVLSLDQISEGRTIGEALSAATVKRLVLDERGQIELYDLLHRTAQDVKARLTTDQFTTNVQPTPEALNDRLVSYEAACAPILPAFATGCYWGGPASHRAWQHAVEVLCAWDIQAGYEVWSKLRYYPAMLCLYLGGIAAVANEHYDTLDALLNKTKFAQDGRTSRAAEVLYPFGVLDNHYAKQLPGYERQFTPISNRLCKVLQPVADTIYLSDVDYITMFDRFEYLTALNYVHVSADLAADGVWGPWGCFAWRGTARGAYPTPVAVTVETEVGERGEKWPPLVAGLFGGSLERFRAVKTAFDSYYTSLSLW